MNRRVWLKSVTAAAGLRSAAAAGTDSLFDGRSLAGWRAPLAELPMEGCWRIHDGMLEAIPIPRIRSGLSTDIWTERTFQAFDLTFEFLADPAANSGVKFQIRRALYVELRGDDGVVIPNFAARRPGAPMAGYSEGLEYQVSDVLEPEGMKRPASRCAGLYGKVAPPDDVRPRSGEWNRGRIRLQADGKLEHWLNDRLAIQTTIATPLRESSIALQHHATRVRFRDLRIAAL